MTFTINKNSPFTLNSQIILLPSLASEGNMNFDGWYTDDGFTTPLTESEVTNDTELYGRYCGPNYTVTLNVNGGDELVVKEMIIDCDRAYGELPTLTRTEATFLGWFTEKTGGEKVESGGKVIKYNNHTLYAHWSINKYTVTFDPSGGSISQSTKTVAFNSTYGVLPTPKMTGYTFLGWFTEITGGDKVESGDKVTNNHTLFAHWNVNNYTLTFVFNNGTEPEVRVLEFNKTIIYPAEPVRAGYSFISWDSDITNMPADNTTITAQWRANNYTVTFNPSGGSVLQSTKVVTFGSVYGELPNATKTGHTFLGWFTEKNESITGESIVETPVNHTLYAHWSVNKYTVTFIFGNGDDPEVRTFEYNSSIVCPEDPVREGFTFGGWDKNKDLMPAYDLTIVALWTSPSNAEKDSNTGLIVGIVVPVIVVVIAVIVAIVLFILYPRKKKKDEIELDNDYSRQEKTVTINNAGVPPPADVYCRVISFPKDEVEGNVPKKSVQSALTYLYPQDYTRPTMKEALAKVGLTEKQVEMVCSACETAAKVIADGGRLFEGFTEEDAAAVAMYTYDFGSKDFESNPYRIINRKNFAGLQKASGLLYLVMSALRKLPRVTGRMLYRGVRGEVNLDKDHYQKGNVVTWPALSSTSPDMEATKAFLAKGSESGKATGTLFNIDKGWGYDIQPYSLFPDEEEILFEPERQFRVTGVIEADLTIINLEMLDTPLSIPEAFGSEC